MSGDPDVVRVVIEGAGERLFERGSKGKDRNELDDGVLVERAQADAAGFALLYERYHPQIRAFVASRIKADAAHVDDLTSRVFVKALAALPGFRVGSFRGWLYRIARNVVIDDLRAWRATEPIERAETAVRYSNAPYEEAVAAMQREALRDALEVLNESQQAIIELRWQGWTVREIGDHLGMHPEAVKSAQYRALDRLRRHFQKTGQIRREDL